MSNFAREKKGWIYTKLAEKEALRPQGGEKQYVSGEGFPYLGRSYRLLLVTDQEAPVKLERGRFKMRRSLVPRRPRPHGRLVHRPRPSPGSRSESSDGKRVSA